MKEELAAIDRACAGIPRLRHFTNYQHCCECSDADEFFQRFSPETLPAVEQPVVTMPLAFLTPEAFRYFLPGILRIAAREGRDYCLGDILFLLEYRLDLLTVQQRCAIRDFLYAAYSRLHSEIHQQVFDYEAIWRILNRLDEEFAGRGSAAGK